MGDEMDMTTQHAPHPGLHSIGITSFHLID